jgi:hypothetical protein
MSEALALSWRGTRADGRRFEAPLDAWGPWLARSNRLLVSLQYGDVAEELATLHGRLGIDIIYDADVDGRRDLDLFAAQVMACDRIVSIDNATVPIAVALDRPVDVVLSFSQLDWRWVIGRTDSSWYPGVRVWCQPEPGDWASAFRALAAAMEKSA